MQANARKASVACLRDVRSMLALSTKIRIVEMMIDESLNFEHPLVFW